MATNPPKGDGRRFGAVRGRSQIYSSKNDRWTKHGSDGRFMDQGEKNDMKYLISRTALSKEIDFRKELGF